MNTMKKLTSMLLAVMLLLTMTSGLAAEKNMPVSRAAAVVAEGKSIETTTTLALNNEMLLGLLSSGMAGAPPSEEQAAGYKTILDAVNKLKIHMISNAKDMSMKLGTEQGELLDAQMAVNPETGDNTITASVVPGYAITVDPAMMQGTLQSSLQMQQMQQNPEAAVKLMAKYGELLNSQIEKEILPAFQKEEGDYTIDNAGQYTTRARGSLTNHQVATTIKALVAVLKDDAEVKGMIDTYLENMAKQTEMQAKMQETAAADAAAETAGAEVVFSSTECFV